MSVAHLYMAKYHDVACGVEHRLRCKNILVQSDSSVNELNSLFLISQMGIVMGPVL